MAVLDLVNDLVLDGKTVQSGGINCVYEKIGQKNQHITQRNGFSLVGENPFKISGEVARGLFFNQNNSISFEAYGSVVYANNYATSELIGIPLSKSRLYFCELIDVNLINDPSDNKSYYSKGLPINIIPNVELNAIISSSSLGQLARGCPTLNGSIYVQLKSGEIYNSDVEDGTKWGTLNFISSEVQPDRAFYIDVLGNQIVSINEKTIEFFYDNGNATGSRLSPRLDLSIDIGGIDGDSYIKNGNRIYFVGKSGAQISSLGIYVIENLSFKKISNPSIDDFLKTLLRPRLSGYFSNGRYFLNVLESDSGFPNQLTLTFDTLSGLWTKSTYPEDFLTSSDELIMSISGNTYNVNTFTEYDSASDIDGALLKTEITSSITLENTNFDTNNFKRLKSLSVNSLPTKNDFFVDVEASNNGVVKFTRQFNINGSVDTKKAHRLGRFKTIQLKVSFGGITSNGAVDSSDEYAQIKSIEVDL